MLLSIEENDKVTTSIDPDEPFVARFTCDDSSFYLNVHGDPTDKTFNHQFSFSVNELKKVTVKGPILVNFMSFVDRGTVVYLI